MLTQRLPDGARKVPREIQEYPLTPTEPTREDTISADLWSSVTKPRAQEARRNSRISATMWRLDDVIVSVRRDLAKDQALIRRLGRAIRASMKTDRRQRAEEAWSEVEALLGS